MKPSSPHSPLAELPRKLACEWVYSIYAWRERSPEFMQTRVGQLEEQFRRAMLEFAERAEKAIEQRIRKVAGEICMGEWATANHALLTHIAIPQAQAAIRELAEGLKRDKK